MGTNPTSNDRSKQIRVGKQKENKVHQNDNTSKQDKCHKTEKVVTEVLNARKISDFGITNVQGIGCVCKECTGEFKGTNHDNINNSDNNPVAEFNEKTIVIDRCSKSKHIDELNNTFCKKYELEKHKTLTKIQERQFKYKNDQCLSNSNKDKGFEIYNSTYESKIDNTDSKNSSISEINSNNLHFLNKENSKNYNISDNVNKLTDIKNKDIPLKMSVEKIENDLDENNLKTIINRSKEIKSFEKHINCNDESSISRFKDNIENRSINLANVVNKIKKAELTKIEKDNPKNKDLFENYHINTYSDDLHKKTNKVKNKIINKDGVEINDNLFIKVLKRNVVEPEKDVKKLKLESEKIYDGLKICSTKELEFESRKYYKFPFNHLTYNDGSSLFNDIFNEWKKALKDIFLQYKEGGNIFFILFKNKILRFSEDAVETNVELIDFFMKNDISFVGKNNKVYVMGIDIALVVDLLMNFEYDRKTALPLILSYLEFENAIVYKTRLRDTGVVQKQGKKTYTYEIEGYFWYNDYDSFLSVDSFPMNT